MPVAHLAGDPISGPPAVSVEGAASGMNTEWMNANQEDGEGCAVGHASLDRFDHCQRPAVVSAGSRCPS